MALCNLCRYILFFIFLVYHNTDAVENCTVIQQEDMVSFKILKFSQVIPQDIIGVSVDLIFSGPVKISQANYISPKPAKLAMISDHHWVISLPKIPRAIEKKAEFTANYTELEADVKLVGIILNGDQVICGEGVTKVNARNQFQIADTKECKPSKIVRYENMSQLTITEDFVSDRIGLAIDIIFDSDVDNIDCHTFFPKKYSNRHYTIFNSGYITTKDRKVEVLVEVFHENKPLPSLSAIVMNDVALCGFSTTRDVLNYEYFVSVSKLLKEADENMIPVANLINSSIIISVFTLLAVIASGVAVWRLSSPTTSDQKISIQPDDESVYAQPSYISPK